MDKDEPGAENDDVRRKSKQGSRNLPSGSCRSFKFSLMRKQLTQLDRLAVEIRAASGNWITRSGIITAILEAASRPELIERLAASVSERSLGKCAVGPGGRVMHAQTARRLRRLAKYILRISERHL